MLYCAKGKFTLVGFGGLLLLLSAVAVVLRMAVMEVHLTLLLGHITDRITASVQIIF